MYMYGIYVLAHLIELWLMKDQESYPSFYQNKIIINNNLRAKKPLNN